MNEEGSGREQSFDFDVHIEYLYKILHVRKKVFPGRMSPYLLQQRMKRLRPV